MPSADGGRTLYVPIGSPRDCSSLALATCCGLDKVADENGIVTTLQHDDSGRRTRVNRPGGYIQYQYNERNWITGVLNRKSNDSTTADSQYYYSDGELGHHVYASGAGETGSEC
jgi:YD repeat-containing protein